MSLSLKCTRVRKCFLNSTPRVLKGVPQLFLLSFKVKYNSCTMAVNSTVKEPTDSWAMYVMTQKHLAFNLKWCIPDSLSDWAEHGSAASNSLSSSYKEDVDGDELPMLCAHHFRINDFRCSAIWLILHIYCTDLFQFCPNSWSVSSYQASL